jgi:hypothetical protein
VKNIGEVLAEIRCHFPAILHYNAATLNPHFQETHHE